MRSRVGPRWARGFTLSAALSILLIVAFVLMGGLGGAALFADDDDDDDGVFVNVTNGITCTTFIDEDTETTCSLVDLTTTGTSIALTSFEVVTTSCFEVDDDDDNGGPPGPPHKKGNGNGETETTCVPQTFLSTAEIPVPTIGFVTTTVCFTTTSDDSTIFCDTGPTTVTQVVQGPAGPAGPPGPAAAPVIVTVAAPAPVVTPTVAGVVAVAAKAGGAPLMPGAVAALGLLLSAAGFALRRFAR